MSQVETTKSFESIHDAYAFFQAHSTEAAADLTGYLPYLLALARSGQPVRLLDFGCGDGLFSSQLLARAGFEPGLLRVGLVEPDPDYRRQAVDRIRPFTGTPVAAWPVLPPGEARDCDLILSNHALYYVTDLAGTVARLLDLLAPGGVLLAAMGDGGNIFAQWMDRVLAVLGEPAPHFRSGDLESALAVLGRGWRQERIEYGLDFPDNEANRIKILRFMLGPYYDRLDRDGLLGLFDAQAVQGRVTARTYHYHYVVGK
jgi:SAM-dependent methyltransferase